MGESGVPAARPQRVSRATRRSPRRVRGNVAYANAITRVAKSDTGSPASAWHPTVAASSVTAPAERRSNTRASAQNTNGTVAIDQDRLGKFVDDTTGPDAASAKAPSAAAGGVTSVRRNKYMPAPRHGTRNATQSAYATPLGR